MNEKPLLRPLASFRQYFRLIRLLEWSNRRGNSFPQGFTSFTPLLTYKSSNCNCQRLLDPPRQGLLLQVQSDSDREWLQAPKTEIGSSGSSGVTHDTTAAAAKEMRRAGLTVDRGNKIRAPETIQPLQSKSELNREP